jgi:diguanylate cyclase (GGDEF)-like protein
MRKQRFAGQKIMIANIIGKSLDQVTALEWESVQSFVTIDQLSQVGNYSFFDLQLQHAWYEHLREQNAIALCYLDIDKFKSINDEQGHAWGDEIISIVGQILKQCSRRSDVIARPFRKGGDEFVIMLPNTDLNGATVFGERIRTAIASLRFSFGQITVSIGVASVVPSDENMHLLVEAADKALYRAKAAGRNRVSI